MKKENNKTETNIIGKLCLAYEKKPELRAMVQLLPCGSSFDTLATYRAREIAGERLKTFFDELAEEKHELTEELVESEDFLHCYFSTVKAVINTRRREKIKMFARLLSEVILPRANVGADEYEDYLQILDELTYRELVVLNTLYKYELQNGMQAKTGLVETNLVIETSKYWSEFITEVSHLLRVEKEEVRGMLSRLNRTGCYQTITGTYFDYEGDQGYLTVLFYKLKEIIRKKTDSF